MITHVITEDSGSGNKFWAEVFGYLLGDSCRIYTSCGITNIGKKFGELLVSISIHNNEGDTVQTFVGRLSSIKSGYWYLGFIDEDNVEHEICYTDYISVKRDEVTE